MTPEEFRYMRPGNLAEAVAALAEPGAKLLSGGQSLLPLMRLRFAAPKALVDLQDVAELKGIEERGSEIRIGAFTRHVDVAASAPWQALREAAEQTGDRQVRRLGTIGGAVSHADPAGDLPAALLALGARVELMGTSGRRSVPLDEFFVGPLMTAAQEDEVLESVFVPAEGKDSGSAYRKLRQEASGFALVGVAARLQFDSAGTCQAAGIGVTGVGLAPYRAGAAEEILLGTLVGDADVEKALGAILEGVDVAADAYASAEYRSDMCRLFAKRAIEAAKSQARA
ncbi:MAG: FAD binding domain-containing protein [Thermaerobacter sp.]|nr:FAD binding domain-containing protein [Thermaerobacter sp.]